MSFDQEPKQETVPTPALPFRDFSNPSREEREQLKALSTQVFGASSRYKKLYEYDHVLTHKVTETVPGENGQPDTEVEKEVPLLYNGSKQSVRRYRTTEEVIQLMLDFKTKREEFLAQMKKQQEEQKSKKEADELAKKVQEDLGGSALT